MIESAEIVDASWSRSWLGYQAELYYEGFQRPPLAETFNAAWANPKAMPAGWSRQTFESLRGVIEGKAGVGSVLKLYGNVKRMVGLLRGMQIECCAGLSPVRGMDRFERERVELEALENHKWGETPDAIESVWMPREAFTMDRIAIQHGFRTPPHLVYKAQVVSCLSIAAACEAFFLKAEKLVMEVRTRLGSRGAVQAVEREEAVDLVVRLCSRLHRALVSPDDWARVGCDTATKEATVQGVLNRILRVHFDDVRREEVTPTYAGAGARCDFLLKDPQVMVEVKVAKQGHGDKEIGEELLVDVQRYQTHPDANVLVCLIWDPDSVLKNPAGLEGDLAKTSTEQMRVVAVVTPGGGR